MRKPFKSGPHFRHTKKLPGSQRRASDKNPRAQLEQGITHLRQHQADLQDQLLALRFGQAEAEGASERFMALFSTVPLAVMVVDEVGQILEINARALALLRPLETDAPLNFLLPLLTSDQAEAVQDGFKQARQDGTCELHELVFDGGSNGLITGDLHIAHVDHSSDDQTTFICAIVDQRPLLAQRLALQQSAQDLSERNDELLQSKNRLAGVINSSLDAIIGVDAQQRVLVCNPAAASLFDYPGESALGLPLSDLMPLAAQRLNQTEPGQTALLGEMTGVTRQGQSLPLEVSVSVEQRHGSHMTTLFAHDLSSRKKLEAHRATLETQLRESQKMQAIGTMAGGIAHDFNNIISAILGNTVLAQQEAGLTPGVSTCLTEIDKAGRRARDLVRQILTFSRHEPLQRAALQLADVVHETVQLLKVTLPPHITLQVQLDPSTPPVLGDATQVEQALLNLCTNAIHAMGTTPGRIGVTLGTTPVVPTEPAAPVMVQLVVCDSGSGMSEQTIQRIFEPFFTTKPVGQGTGLGLSVVHGIMRAHQGRVQVDSTQGVGSTFTLHFPALIAPPATAMATTSPQTSAHGTGQRVMYVDDDEALVFLVKRVLTRKGYTVLTYTDPQAAIAALRANPDMTDLLVTDFNMPGYSGVDLLQDVQRLRPSLPVALASGFVTPEIEQAARAAGAQALIHKPNDVDELCHTVQALLNKSCAGG